MSTRLVAGCMTGTSMDALDVALVRIEGRGLGLRAELVRHASTPLGELATGLRRLAEGKATSIRRLAEISCQLGELHRDAIGDLAGDQRLDLAALHGQTLYHAPPRSVQLIDPNPVAHGLGVPVVFDLRAADLACGGEGAPITPLADFLLFFDPSETRLIVNLGGFASYTLLPPSVRVERIEGGDLCACNQLLDEIARVALRRRYDEDGARAAGGTVKAREYLDLAAMLEEQASGGTSLGTGDEMAAWVEGARRRLSAADLARTACAAIAKVIADRTRGVDRVLLAGGGVANLTLREEIASRSAGILEQSDAHGIPTQAREAVAMAVLGALCQDREPITLSQVTGCAEPAPIAGAWILP